MICERCEREIIDEALVTMREAKSQTKMECIARVICELYHIHYDRLRGRGRNQHETFARQMFMHLVRRMTNKSYPAIGSYLNRDHSTCIHGDLAITARRTKEPAFNKYVEKIEAKIKEEGPGWQSNSTPMKSPDALPPTMESSDQSSL